LEEAANPNAPAATNGKSVSIAKDASANEDFEEGEIEGDEGDESTASAIEGVDSKYEPQTSAQEPQANVVADSTLNDASQPRPAATGKSIL
jgi:hypothetical protein